MENKEEPLNKAKKGNLSKKKEITERKKYQAKLDYISLYLLQFLL